MGDVLADIRLGVALAMLLGASVSDLRTRRVRNHYWFPFIALAAVFLLHDAATGALAASVLWYLIAMGATLFWYMVWRLRLFGGADAKGLMVLAWLVPVPLHPTLPVPPSFLAVALGCLAALLLPLLFLARNALHGDLRLPAALLGRPLPIDQAQAIHVWPMQRATPEGLKWRYWQHVGADIDQVYAGLRAAGVQRVWTTPKLPFMGFIAVGFVAAWLLGEAGTERLAQLLP